MIIDHIDFLNEADAIKWNLTGDEPEWKFADA